MSGQSCTETLTGLFAGITLHCTLDVEHHGRHEAAVAGFTVEWSPNSYQLLHAAAA